MALQIGPKHVNGIII